MRQEPARSEARSDDVARSQAGRASDAHGTESEQPRDAHGAESERQHPRHPLAVAPTRSEWVSALIGAALVLGAIAYLLASVLLQANTPPDIRIEVGPVEVVGDGYLVRFRVHNLGQMTVAGLTVQAQLRRGSRVVEARSTTIGYVPSGASRRGGFFFEHDPRAFRLDIRPGGYRKP